MGSILRPASYCGIVGFKPSFGLWSCEGVLAFAPSLDTVGLLADSVEVCRNVFRVLNAGVGASQPLRFGIPAGLPSVSPEMQSTFSRAIERIRRQFTVDPVQLPASHADMLAAARTVNDYEGARSHQERWRQYGPRIGEKLSALVLRGTQMSRSEYDHSLALLRSTSQAVDESLSKGLILLVPAANGSAPLGLSSTGDPVMNAVWTALGTPAISVPMPESGAMPLGMQMIARSGADGSLLKAAAMVEQLFAGDPSRL